MSHSGDASISSLRNLGDVSEKCLNEVGIKTRADLEKVGPVAAYKMVEATGFNPSLNFLYAMVAALLDVHWDEIPDDMKEQLKKEIR